MIYYKIKELRLLNKLNVAFLASELQISISKYNAIESGLVDLKLSKIFRIAEILGVSAFELFDSSEFKFSNSSSAFFTELGYIPFSDSCVKRYIFKLKQENKILGGY